MAFKGIVLITQRLTQIPLHATQGTELNCLQNQEVMYQEHCGWKAKMHKEIMLWQFHFQSLVIWFPQQDQRYLHLMLN